MTRPVDLYRGQPWYTARPEPECDLVGRLDRAPVVVGPGTRTARSFTLRTPDDMLGVYAAGIEDLLAPFVGATVRIRGRIVDLGVGDGREIWIATVLAVRD
jgi:hypothetical protein